MVVGYLLLAAWLFPQWAMAQAPRTPLQFPRPSVTREPRADAPGSLVVEGVPKTAEVEVLLDQTRLGLGRIHVPITELPSSKSLRVRVFQSGYAERWVQVTLQPGKSFETNVVLEPLPASLKVNALPQPSQFVVAWEGEARTNSTWVAMTGLPSGRKLQVTALAPQCAPLTNYVQLLPGEEWELNLGSLTTMITNGWLEVSCTPPDAEITCQLQGGERKVLPPPWRLRDIPFGNWVSVTAEKEGYRSDTRTVTINSSTGQMVSFQLSKRVSETATLLVSGVPAGALVEVMDGPTALAKGKVNEEITDLPPERRVTVKASSPQYKSAERSFVLQPGRNVTQLDLQPAASPPSAAESADRASTQSQAPGATPKAVIVAQPQSVAPAQTNSAVPMTVQAKAEVTPTPATAPIPATGELKKALDAVGEVRQAFEAKYPASKGSVVNSKDLDAWIKNLQEIGKSYALTAGRKMDNREEPWISIERLKVSMATR